MNLKIRFSDRYSQVVNNLISECFTENLLDMEGIEQIYNFEEIGITSQP